MTRLSKVSSIVAFSALTLLPGAAAAQLEFGCFGGQPDGVVQPGEDCDDGNLICGDGCDPSC